MDLFAVVPGQIFLYLSHDLINELEPGERVGADKGYHGKPTKIINPGNVLYTCGTIEKKLARGKTWNS